MRKLIATISTIFICIGASAQDPQFTQFYANPLYLAPSFAGAIQQDRVALVYRNQWPGLPGSFVTFNFSYDHFFENFNSGVGVLLMRDKAGTGDYALTSAAIQYSYDIKINNQWHVRPGLYVSYYQTSIDYIKLTWNSQLTGAGVLDPNQIYGNDFVLDVDVGSSALAYSDRYWFGFGVDHLYRPKYGLYIPEDFQVPRTYKVFGGAQVLKRGRLFNPIDESLSLAFLFRHQDINNQLDLGVYWLKSPLMLGFWYRGIPILSKDPRGDAIAFLIGYKMDDLRVGYSYDFTVSNLVSSTGGAHEISVVYEFKTTRARRKVRMVPCPEF